MTTTAALPNADVWAVTYRYKTPSWEGDDGWRTQILSNTYADIDKAEASARLWAEHLIPAFEDVDEQHVFRCIWKES